MVGSHAKEESQTFLRDVRMGHAKSGATLQHALVHPPGSCHPLGVSRIKNFRPGPATVEEAPHALRQADELLQLTFAPSPSPPVRNAIMTVTSKHVKTLG